MVPPNGAESRENHDMLWKERDINGVRQTFLRWNPNFEDYFEYIPGRGWLPIRGEVAEIERRVKKRVATRREARQERNKEQNKTHGKRYAAYCSKGL
jgi:hypothetical protein